MPRFPWSFLAVALVASCALVAQGPVTDASAKLALRFAPAVGSVAHCTLRAESDRRGDAIGAVVATLALHCERTVVAAKDGVVTVRYRFVRVTGSMRETPPDGKGDAVAYDSDIDKASPVPLFPDIVGDTMVCKVDVRGRTVEVEAPKGMTFDSYRLFALDGDPSSLLRLFDFELPDAAVAAGDVWAPRWWVGKAAERGFAFSSACKLLAVADGKAAVLDVAKVEAREVDDGRVAFEVLRSTASASIDVADGSVVALARELQLEGVLRRGREKVQATMRWSMTPAAAPPAKAKADDKAKDGEKPQDAAPGGGG